MTVSWTRPDVPPTQLFDCVHVLSEVYEHADLRHTEREEVLRVIRIVEQLADAGGLRRG